MTLTVADLRAVDLFDDASDDEVSAWIAVAEDKRLARGEILVEQGTVAPGLHFLLEGTVRNVMLNEGRAEPAGVQRAPTWMGAIATLTEGPLGIRAEADSDIRVMHVPADDAVRLALSQPAVHRRIMLRIAPVMNRIAGMEQSRERLESLGTMAAGLAHELNNPAAAARRSAAHLVEALDAVARTLGRFVDAGIEREQAHVLVKLHEEALALASGQTALSALDAADAEDELLDALEEAGIADAWRFAPILAPAGVDARWIARVRETAGPATDATIEWLAASLVANELAGELIESTDRMSKLVGAVKSYAYMDRGGERSDVDLHEGLETTLTVLNHKLKHTSIEVRREYDRSLPPLHAFGSELNQVWTNLIHNAIGALGESGTITIRTRRDGDCAEVDVADDGPGIDPEIRERIFEPFFTTKEVGAGTGLGLDAARRIVVDRHGGSLKVDSEPGRTVFTVRIPLS